MEENDTTYIFSKTPLSQAVIFLLQLYEREREREREIGHGGGGI
jgi:hypothetical protein